MSPDKKYMGSGTNKNKDDLNLVPFKSSMPSMMPIGWIPVFSFNKLNTPVMPSTMMPDFSNIYSSMNNAPFGSNSMKSAGNIENFPSDEITDNLYSYNKSNTNSSPQSSMNVNNMASSNMNSGNSGTSNMNNSFPGTNNMNSNFPGTSNMNNNFPGTSNMNSNFPSTSNMNSSFPGTSNMNMSSANRSEEVSDVLRNYFADLDENTDLCRHCSDKRIDKIYAKIQEKDPEIIAMLIDNYKIPCPIAKAAIRKIIKLSLQYCKKAGD